MGKSIVQEKQHRWHKVHLFIHVKGHCEGQGHTSRSDNQKHWLYRLMYWRMKHSNGWKSYIPFSSFLKALWWQWPPPQKPKGSQYVVLEKKKRKQLNISSVRTQVRDNDNNTTIYQSSVSLEKTTTAACIRSKSLTWNIRNIFSTYVHTIHVILCTTFVSIWIMFTLQANDGIVFLSRHLHQLNFFVLKI